MKNLKSLLKRTVKLLFLVLTLIFTSCESSNECHSCDSKINQWVEENIDEIAQFERDKISTFSHNYQKAILGAIPSDRKKELWTEKIDHILNLDLSMKELDYLKWYEGAFKEINYYEPTRSELAREMYNRTIEGMKKFGWNKDFVYQTFFLIGNVGLQKPIVQNLKQEEEEEGVACGCMYDIGCGIANGTCNEDVTCNSSSDDDCGFFGNSDCEGECI